MPELLVQHGLLVLFAWAFAVQAGMPAPAIPMLVGAGALAGSGQMSFSLAVGVTMAAAVSADVLWYSLGLSQGTRVLGLLSRFSLRRDSLVRDAKERFVAHGARYVVMAKFLPGLNPFAAGLAGAVPIRPGPFLLYAAAGSLAWAGLWITLGYLCADLIGRVAKQAAGLGRPLGILVVAGLVAYVVYYYVRRQYFLRHLQKARIAPTELKRRLEAGDRFMIVDLRTPVDIEKAPYRIPGARWMTPEAVRGARGLIPPGHEVVFYCAEPREATSARTALFLASLHLKNAHPLSGGIESWREAGFEVEPMTDKVPIG